MDITIDCSAIDSRESLHRVFAEALSFPEWYGKNLDALHDCLTEISGTIRLENWDIAEAKLGRYGLTAKTAIAKAAFENPNLEIIL